MAQVMKKKKEMEGDKPACLTIFSAFQLQLDGSNLLTQSGRACAGRKGGKVGDTPNRAQHHLGPVQGMSGWPH